MQKGERTRQHILEQAAQVFILKGYHATSYSDLTAATGLEKGGIYNHFGSKDELVVEAFTYWGELVRQRAREFLRDQPHTLDRLRGVIAVYHSLIDRPILSSGCFIMNLAIEADDTHPVLREKAQQAMTEWREYIVRTVQKGIERQEIRADVDADRLATLILSMMEGAIMMSKLYGDSTHIQRAAEHLWHYVDTLTPEQA